MDKFLKVSRLVKRREVAKELCEHGDVSLNGRTAKPMSEVNEGDLLTIKMGRHTLSAKIRSVRPFANKEQSVEMVEILSDEVA